MLEWVEFPFEVENGWFSGKTAIRTYNLNELLGTKLRALYQRSKGRDLFDIYYSNLMYDLNYDQILTCYNKYMTFSAGKPPSKKEFLLNIKDKENDPNFSGDMTALLRTGINYDQSAAVLWLKKELIDRMK
ncbi:MAG: nucleotidyl transferase AbiEii/AbiGii toxin family protein [Candidatus Delongbacteria bacterium]|nr:nucleotidyl transferase AbiEii/AbiGii toxin family protein [Candidatus Delongbacteria bacterium]